MQAILLPATAMAQTVLAALLLYLASPNQQLIAPHGRTRSVAIAGWLALAAALALLLGWAGPATAVFILLTLATLIWTIVPLFAAWWHGAGTPQ